MNNENSEEQEVGVTASPLDNEESSKSSASSEYIKDLLKEKTTLDPEQHGHAMRLLDEEVMKAQAAMAAGNGKSIKPEARFIDLAKEKPMRVAAKVLVPVKEHPQFNFVGKLLGPKGSSLKRLQEETMTKMAILGRGSIRDKAKEEELRNSLDPKYSHLSDELHVEIHAYAPAAEAYARVAYALTEVTKYLVPDDEMRQGGAVPPGKVSRPGRAGGPPAGLAPPPPMPPLRGPPGGRGGGGRGPIMGPGRPVPPPPYGAPLGPGRAASSKAKVMSILDKARSAMDESYGPVGYDDGGCYETAAPVGYGSAYNGSGFYDGGGYGGGGENAAGGTWKTFRPSPNKRLNAAAAGGKAANPLGARFGKGRPTPYGRPPK